MVGPTGVSKPIDSKIPASAHTTAITAEERVTVLKLLNSLIDAIAGKTISAETRRDPTSLMEMEITIAVMTASMRL